MREGASIHEWVRHYSEDGYVFHVYLARTPGTPSVCGAHPVIDNIGEMDIPGDVSVCCLQCFAGLYGLNKGRFPIFRGYR